jgi:hypothetical protein
VEKLLEGAGLKTGAYIKVEMWMKGVDWIYLAIVRNR